EYAKNLADVWTKQGHKVTVKIFGNFQKYPWGLRHILFFFYIIPSVIFADYIFTLEAFSSGIVTIASKIFFKKVIFRTGGDLLWESYTERTGDTVLLKDFYQTSLDKLSRKEKIIFSLMKWTLRNLSAVIWSTEWQKDIFMKPYRLEEQRHFIVENYYGPRLNPVESSEKNFIGSARKLKWKNIEMLQNIFESQEVKSVGVRLEISHIPHEQFLEKIRQSYAVIVASFGDISPNTILDAIRCQKPFIVTKETGIYERIKDVAVFVDPKNPDDIKERVLWLSIPQNYELQKKKLQSFNFTHSWEEMADEYLRIYDSIK
ncbi:MAG: hypothetical protein ABL899_03215, partial [Nitrospira sp.]